MGHQYPTSQPVFHFVQAVTGGYLRGLHSQPLAKTVQLLCQSGQFVNELPQRLSIAAVRTTISLRNEPRRTGTVSHQDG